MLSRGGPVGLEARRRPRRDNAGWLRDIRPRITHAVRRRPAWHAACDVLSDVQMHDTSGRRTLRLGLGVLVLLWLACTDRAVAQTQTMNLAMGLGGGFERGAGYGLLEGRRSPIFLEGAVRTYLDEEPTLVLGGSLRFELERGIGLAVVPRAEIRSPGDFLELRPGVGVPIFVSPRFMVGPEVALSARIGGRRGLGYFAMGSIAAFFLGSDVPDDSTVVMMNLQLGIDLQI